MCRQRRGGRHYSPIFPEESAGPLSNIKDRCGADESSATVRKNSRSLTTWAKERLSIGWLGSTSLPGFFRVKLNLFKLILVINYFFISTINLINAFIMMFTVVVELVTFTIRNAVTMIIPVKVTRTVITVHYKRKLLLKQ